RFSGVLAVRSGAFVSGKAGALRGARDRESGIAFLSAWRQRCIVSESRLSRAKFFPLRPVGFLSGGHYPVRANQGKLLTRGAMSFKRNSPWPDESPQLPIAAAQSVRTTV